MKDILLKGILLLILLIFVDVDLEAKADTISLNQKQNVCSKKSAKDENPSKESIDEPKRKGSAWYSSDSNSRFFTLFFENIEPLSPVNSTLLKSYIRHIYPATNWLDDKSLHILEIL